MDQRACPERAGPFCVLKATVCQTESTAWQQSALGRHIGAMAKGARNCNARYVANSYGTRWYPGVRDPDFGTQTSGPSESGTQTSGPRLRDPNFGTTAANTQTAKCTGEAHWRYDKSTRNCNARYVANSYGTRWYPGVWDSDFGTLGVRDPDFGTLGVRDPDFGTLGVRDPDFGTQTSGPKLRDHCCEHAKTQVAFISASPV